MRYLDDYRGGETHRFTIAGIGEEEIVAFARQWDPQRIHVDPDFAATGPHGGLITSGFQTILHVFRPIMGLMSEMANIGGLGFDELRWLQPWRPEEPLEVVFTVLSVAPSRSKPDRGVMKYKLEAYNPAGELIFLARTGVMVKRRTESPS